MELVLSSNILSPLFLQINEIVGQSNPYCNHKMYWIQTPTWYQSDDHREAIQPLILCVLESKEPECEADCSALITLKEPSCPLFIVYMGWSQSSYLSVRPHMYSYISEPSNHIYVMIKKLLLQSQFHYPLFLNTHIHCQFTYCSSFIFY